MEKIKTNFEELCKENSEFACYVDNCWEEFVCDRRDELEELAIQDSIDQGFDEDESHSMVSDMDLSDLMDYVDEANLTQEFIDDWKEFHQETTTTMAIITTENEEWYTEESNISTATLGDMIDADWGYDDCGLEEDGENENGEMLFTSDLDFDGKLTTEELKDIETGWFKVSYWDGNNWKKDIFEYYTTEEMIIESDTEKEPEPKWNFCYKITRANGDIMEATQSNCSGSLSPYYDVEQ